MGYEYFGNQMLGVALTLPRIAAAFLMLPLLTSENMPALVRNSFFVSLAIIVFPLASASSSAVMTHGPWAFIILKEIFIGVSIGFAFGAVFWGIGSAGNFIDAKIGTSMASVVDPLGGHQTSLSGAFLTQLAAWLFMSSGAFMVEARVGISGYAGGWWTLCRDVSSFWDGGRAAQGSETGSAWRQSQETYEMLPRGRL